MRAPVELGKELRLAFVALVTFWSIAALCFFFGKLTPAFTVATFGTLAASEHFFRAVANSTSLPVRGATLFVWLVIIAANFWLGAALLLPHGPLRAAT